MSNIGISKVRFAEDQFTGSRLFLSGVMAMVWYYIFITGGYPKIEVNCYCGNIITSLLVRLVLLVWYMVSWYN